MLCGWGGNRRPGGTKWQPNAGWMTYGHLRADCLYIGISSGSIARYRVGESLYLLPLPQTPETSPVTTPHRREAVETRRLRYLGHGGVDVDEEAGRDEELDEAEKDEARRQNELDHVSVLRRVEVEQRRRVGRTRRLGQHLPSKQYCTFIRNK